MEALAAQSSLLERLADGVAAGAWRAQFVTLHVLWFLAWMLLNSGAIVVVAASPNRRFSDKRDGIARDVENARFFASGCIRAA